MADRDIPEEIVELRAEIIAALCTDHGHVRRVGGMDCRTCTRRADAVLSVLAGRTVLDTKPDGLDPAALNAVANAVHDHYGFVRLDVRYRAAAAAIRIVNEWQATPIPGAAGSGVGDQDGE